MEKPLVSSRDWRLALLRLTKLFYYIDTKQLGDPFDDLWFNFDSNELEIGVKPEKGVFIGEVRDFYVAGEDSTFNSKKFADVFSELSDKGIIEVDETVDFDDNPLRYCAEMLEDVCKTYPEPVWKKIGLWSNTTFTDAKFIKLPDRDFDYPIFIGGVNDFLDRVGEPIPPDESGSLNFISVHSLFDMDFYIKKTMFRTVAEEFFQKFQQNSYSKRAEINVYCSRGLNRLYFTRDGFDSDCPYNCGSMGSIGNAHFYWIYKGRFEIFKTCVISEIYNRMANVQTDGWERRV